MLTLGREIRFSIDPFSQTQQTGSNSYASKPLGGEGLCLYLSLGVELSSRLNPDTGFVVNVTEIDKAVLNLVVPFISKKISDYYSRAQLPTLDTLGGILKQCWKTLQQEFSDKHLTCLVLNLNPYRSIRIQSEESMDLYYSEKFEFSAMHQLWNDKFDDAQNYEMFGKCANPAGHGHNYIVEISVRGEPDPETGRVISETLIDAAVDAEIMEKLDHRNLNDALTRDFGPAPTTEVLVLELWRALEPHVPAPAVLHRIRVSETSKNFFEYFGPGGYPSRRQACRF